MKNEYTTDLIIDRLNFICAYEHLESDESFAQKIEAVHNEVIRFNTSIFYNHSWTNQIIERRVKEYCRRKGIDVTEYKGPLPYLVVKISIPKNK